MDVSDDTAGAVQLKQDYGDDVAYFSEKFNQHQNIYLTIKKELLVLILALRHKVYIYAGQEPLTAHNDYHPSGFE